MVVPLPWYAVAVATTLINGATLGFIAWREQNQALRLWSWAWLAWAAAALPLMMFERGPLHHAAALLCGLLWVCSTLCFLGGTYRLAERAMPRAWFVVAAACAFTAVALGIAPTGQAGMLPLVLFQSVGLLAAGVRIVRTANGRAGAWLCGVALIALAAHVLDAPIVVMLPALLPWGFVVATALQLLTALGMITLHYEIARSQLLAAQRALEEARRIEALGRVAAGVAHDFNNVLTVIQGNVDLLRFAPNEAERIEETLTAIEHAVAQAGRLTSQLLAFGRRSVIQPQSTDLLGIVSGTLNLLRKVIPKEVELDFSHSDESLVGRIDRALLEQIVLNLVTNARDAISGQGRISVELRRASPSTNGVLLRVTDDGSGMDENLLSQVFEPFFTTKEAGRGTGLGLASVQGAANQLGGRVRVESSPGRGSLFEVFLPLGASESSLTPRPPAPEVGLLDRVGNEPGHNAP